MWRKQSYGAKYFFRAGFKTTFLKSPRNIIFKRFEDESKTRFKNKSELVIEVESDFFFAKL